MTSQCCMRTCQAWGGGGNGGNNLNQTLPLPALSINLSLVMAWLTGAVPVAKRSCTMQLSHTSPACLILHSLRNWRWDFYEISQVLSPTINSVLRGSTYALLRQVKHVWMSQKWCKIAEVLHDRKARMSDKYYTLISRNHYVCESVVNERDRRMQAETDWWRVIDNQTDLANLYLFTFCCTFMLQLTSLSSD